MAVTLENCWRKLVKAYLYGKPDFKVKTFVKDAGLETNVLVTILILETNVITTKLMLCKIFKWFLSYRI